MKQIDMSSTEFVHEMEKTKKFTDKVNKQFGWVYNPNHDVNEGERLAQSALNLLSLSVF